MLTLAFDVGTYIRINSIQALSFECLQLATIFRIALYLWTNAVNTKSKYSLNPIRTNWFRYVIKTEYWSRGTRSSVLLFIVYNSRLSCQ